MIESPQRKKGKWADSAARRFTHHITALRSTFNPTTDGVKNTKPAVENTKPAK